MRALLEAKAKAVAAAVVTAVVGYVALALQQQSALTVHGLEAAAAGAVLGFLGVHQAPKNKERKTAHRQAGYTPVEAVVAVCCLVILVLLIVFLVQHIG